MTTSACDLMRSCLCGTWNLITNNRISTRIYSNATWLAHRTKEVKINEIPFFLRHPRLIINLCRRQRVKDAMANLAPTKITTTFSRIFPAHPIEGNYYAVKKNQERVLTLKRHKHQFTLLFAQRNPITGVFLDRILPSTSPMQFALDSKGGNYIAFQGSGRLIALKAFCVEEFPNHVPEMEINAYHINDSLVSNALHFS